MTEVGYVQIYTEMMYIQENKQGKEKNVKVIASS